MKKKLLLISLLSLAIFATGCGKKPLAEVESSNEEMQTLVDMLGNEVLVKKDIETIAVTPIPWASLVYSLDAGADRLVSIHPSAMKSYEISFLKELSKDFADIDTSIIGKDFSINMESMAQLDPDLVIVWDYQTEEIKQLKDLGIPALAIKYGSLESLQEGISLLGKILNQEERAEKLVAYHQEKIQFLREKTQDLNPKLRPSMVYLRDRELTIFGQDSVNQIYFDLTGGANLAAKTLDKTAVNMEEIIDWNPDMIYLSNFDDFTSADLKSNAFEGQDWSQLDAVAKDQVYKTPIGLYRWDAPCAETPLMMMWMAKTQQPDLFKDLNLNEELKSFYKEFLDFQLSDAQVEQILNSQANKNLRTN